MSKALLDLEELRCWINADPLKREKVLIDEVPIARTTLNQMLTGRYVPSPLLSNAIRAVIGRYPTANSQSDGGKAATG